MTHSEAAETLIKESEGCRLIAYLDSNSIPTIGWGSIYMPNLTRVVMGNTITQDEADTMFQIGCADRDKQLNEFLGGRILTQNQYDALFDFGYNLGFGTLNGSTLFHKVKINPADPTIADEFKKWVHAGINIVPGLVIRRGKEIAMYFNIPFTCKI